MLKLYPGAIRITAGRIPIGGCGWQRDH